MTKWQSDKLILIYLKSFWNYIYFDQQNQQQNQQQNEPKNEPKNDENQSVSPQSNNPS